MIAPDSIFHHATALTIWTIVWQGIQMLFGSVVSAMETPDQNSSSKYRFWFKLLNNVNANFKRAVVTKYQAEDGSSIATVPISRPSTDTVVVIPVPEKVKDAQIPVTDAKPPMVGGSSDASNPDH